MGMQFSLVTEKFPEDEYEIPGRFYNYIEGEDAYGETSEYYILSQKIDLKLDLFIERAFPIDDDYSEGLTEIQILKELLINYLDRISKINNPEELVAYDPRKKLNEELYSKMLRSWDDEIQKQYDNLNREIMEDSSHPYYFLPPDRGYLSEGKLKADLCELIKALESFERSGRSYIKIAFF
jgi:hypothetical protein